MTIPGPVITERDAQASRGSATNTGTWFVALPAERGPVDATPILAADSFRRIFGNDVAYSNAATIAEKALAEGVRRIVFARVVGPAATKASRTFKDSGNADSIRFEAIGPDTFSNGLKVGIVGSGPFVIVVQDSTGSEVERSPDLADISSAVAWANGSDYGRVVPLGSNLPVAAAPAALSGGNDDRVNITDQSYRDALAKFTLDFGPGQVSIPGRATGTAHADLKAHELATGRVAFLDVNQTDVTKAQLKATAQAARPGLGSERAAIFGPWVLVGGIAPGVVRELPASAVAAGQAARVDASGNPNQAAAGDNGVSRTAIGVKGARLSDSDRGELNDVGLNLLRRMGDDIVTYGYRTLVDPLVRPLHWQLANARLDMAVSFEARAIAERFQFSQLDDGTIQRFGGELSNMLGRFYVAKALYGKTPDEAYSVDVGESVNTPDSIARGELKAVISIKRSPMAEKVIVEEVKVAIGQAV